MKGGEIKKMSVVKKIQDSQGIFNALMIIGFLGIVWLMIYGNLSGNLGFTAGTQGYIDTQNVITNMTQGATTFFGFSKTFFTVTAIVLLVTILFGLVAFVIGLTKKSGNSSGFAE